MRILVSIFLWMIASGVLTAQEDFQMKEGDLLFQDSDCGPLCEAIERVTMGYHEADLSHVGIVHQKAGNWFVIEAISGGVAETPLQNFLDRSYDTNGKPKVIAGRLKRPYQSLIPDALDKAIELKVEPYDEVYKMGDDRYYCSELIYEIFKSANQGKNVFKLFPMTFKDPDTRETFPAWEAYFHELGHPIPEDKPGLNPGGISRSDALRIVHVYGYPDHFEPQN